MSFNVSLRETLNVSSNVSLIMSLIVFLRVTLNPPKPEKSFASTGAQKELTLILREIRVSAI